MVKVFNGEALCLFKKLAAGFAALLMFGALASCSAGGSSAASSAESASGSSAAAASSKVESIQAPTDFTSEEARQAMLAKSADFPSKFDLRDVDGRSYVTPVRLQNPFGICWGFAAIAASEVNILGSVLTDDPEAYKTLDLSEKQISYFSHIAVTDESSSQYGEGMHVRDEVAANGISSEDIYAGGSTFLATNTFATGVGPVSESRDLSLEYRGAKGNVDKKQAADGSEYDFSYSADDDWNIGEEHRYQQDYVLKESYLLPCPAVYSNTSAAGSEGSSASAAPDTDANAAAASTASGSASAAASGSSSASASGIEGLSDVPAGLLDSLGDFGVEYSYNEAGTAAIKDQLLQKRAVTIGFHADASKPWEEGNTPEYMNPDTWAHFTWENVLANHAVTIVGWDDDYPAENFLADHKPEGNGAWLVKNSWGSGENEFPNKGYGLWGIPVEKKDANGNPVLDANGKPVMVGSGYFWLSYYDRTISNPETFVFDTSWNDPALSEVRFLDEVHRHQYDLMPATGVGGVKSAGELKSANVFTAEKDEYLICTSFETTSPGTTVSYEVYLLSPEHESPVDGVLMASGEKTYEYGGYYMEFLDQYITLREGQAYSIVVTQRLDTGEYAVDVPIGLGKDSQLQAMMSELEIPQYAVAVVNEGESHVYVDGSWQDWSNEDVRFNLMAPDELARTMVKAADPQYDNFPLKGFAADSLISGSLKLSGGEEKLRLKAGGEGEELKLEIAGDAANVLEKSDLSITWKLAPGGDELVTLDPSKDGFEAKVSASKAGKTFLYVTDAVLGTTIVPIEVE